MSAADLRARVNDLADRLASGLERTADRIITETRDPSVRRRALAFKVDVIPAVYTAAYRADPLVAAVDTWALAFQVREYVETGAGRDAFGTQQPLARAQARELVADADASVQGVATSQQSVRRCPRQDGKLGREPSDRACVLFALVDRSGPGRVAVRAPGRLLRRRRGHGHGPEPLGAPEHVRGADAQAGPLAGRAAGRGVDRRARRARPPGRGGPGGPRASWPRSAVPCSRT